MKKIMVCIDLNNESLEVYKKQNNNIGWGHFDEIHLVHSFQRQIYTDNFCLTSYPSDDQFNDIEKSIVDTLEKISSEIIPDKFKGKTICKCLLSNLQKKSLVDYATENDIAQMLIATRGKHGIEGIFSSSLAEYMVRHAPCGLKIIR